MALAATTMYEINASATAGNVNGGGFNYANANFINNFTATAANTSAPVIASASYNFVAGDVGAWVYISAGTNWATGSFFQIASVASNQATLNAAVGAGQVLSGGRWIANTVAGAATVASPTGGTIGIDYSRSTAARTSGTDLACADGDNNPSAITSASAPFGANHVGNLLHITATTGNYAIGFYEIVSVSGVTATIDRAISATNGALTNGVFFLGGALSLGSSTASLTDDAVFEATIAGNIYWVKSGTITLGVSISVAATLSVTTTTEIIGYNTKRGDDPTGTSRPTIAMTTLSWDPGLGTHWRHLIFTGTAASMINPIASCKLINCKVTNSSTTTDRAAITISGADTAILNCELVSLFGNGVKVASFQGIIKDCYIHACRVGIQNASADATTTIKGCIIRDCFVAAIQNSSAQASAWNIMNCTLFGRVTPLGIGVDLAANCVDQKVYDCIISGFATGLSHATSGQTGTLALNNNYYNNTTDVTNWVKGPVNWAINPNFAITEVNIATGTTSGTALTKAGATFVTSGVTAGRDFVYISGGAGTTKMMYPIASVDSETQLTLGVAPGNSAGDVTASIQVGANFATTASTLLNSTAGQSFAGGYTIANTPIGAFNSAGGRASTLGVGQIKIYG